MIKRKYIVSFFIPLLVIILFASCHSEKKANLILSIVDYDFGDICSDSIYKGRSTITNSGNIPLIIDKIDSDCGCTSVAISKNVILPQDTCLLTFNYSTYNKIGLQENFICIIANTDSLVHLLQINAYVN